MVELGIFYFFAFILVLAGLMVVTARNPVHAALFLVLAFFMLGLITFVPALSLMLVQ